MALIDQASGTAGLLPRGQEHWMGTFASPIRYPASTTWDREIPRFCMPSREAVLADAGARDGGCNAVFFVRIKGGNVFSETVIVGAGHIGLSIAAPLARCRSSLSAIRQHAGELACLHAYRHDPQIRAVCFKLVGPAATVHPETLRRGGEDPI